MKRVHSARGYTIRIKRYFESIKGQFHMELLPAKSVKDKGKIEYQKIWDVEPEPPTLSGLALFLGFNSRNEFEAYEQNGEFANHVKKARLKVEAEYEKKLHYQSATGAIFVLKSLGWAERPDGSLLADIPKTLKIEIIESGPKLASSEKEVLLNEGLKGETMKDG
ncbi:terminase small subunit [Mucilaginibacter phyllosphaerae]